MRLPALGSLRLASAAPLCGHSHQNREDQIINQTYVFIGGQDGYHTFRFPSITVIREGTALAYCQGRRYSSADKSPSAERRAAYESVRTPLSGFCIPQLCPESFSDASVAP